jgi:hypothetical protein
MDKENDDEITTPDTSRSNSIDQDGDRPSSPPILRSNIETNQMESSSPNRDETTTTDVTEHIKATIAAKRATFISSSSSSASESETDYVAVNKKDVDSFEPTSLNVVSLIID